MGRLEVRGQFAEVKETHPIEIADDHEIERLQSDLEPLTS
jgi:hypothetical protein